MNNIYYLLFAQFVIICISIVHNVMFTLRKKTSKATTTTTATAMPSSLRVDEVSQPCVYKHSRTSHIQSMLGTDSMSYGEMEEYIKTQPDEYRVAYSIGQLFRIHIGNGGACPYEFIEKMNEVIKPTDKIIYHRKCQACGQHTQDPRITLEVRFVDEILNKLFSREERSSSLTSSYYIRIKCDSSKKLDALRNAKQFKLIAHIAIPDGKKYEIELPKIYN